MSPCSISISVSGEGHHRDAGNLRGVGDRGHATGGDSGGKAGSSGIRSGDVHLRRLGAGGIEARVARHLKSEKRLRWHIDCLLSHPGVEVVGVYVWETTERRECEVARMLAGECEVVPGFGSTDSRCRGHLFRCEPVVLSNIIREAGFVPFTPSRRAGEGNGGKAGDLDTSSTEAHK